jgi:hypothetical protein
MEDGYIILRDVVPPATLGPLRDAVERMVEGRRGRTSQKPLPNQPPSGTWADSRQPWLISAPIATPVSPLNSCSGKQPWGVCRQLIDAEHVAVHNMNAICSSDTHDTGPGSWHRDVGPGEPAPLLV